MARPPDPRGRTARGSTPDARAEHRDHRAVDGADGVQPGPAPASSPPGGRGGGWRRVTHVRTFDSLRNRGFRWYMISSLCYGASFQAQMLVRGVLVYDLTGSYAALGAIALARAVPGMTLTLFGGLVADRLPKRHVLQVGQAGSVVIALAIGVLLLVGRLTFVDLLVGSFLQGTINAFIVPARLALVPEIVGRERLMNAISLRAAVRNLNRLLAPTAAGVLMIWIGAGSVYLLMAALYGASVVTLLGVPLVPAAARATVAAGEGAASAAARARAELRQLADGLRYIARDRNLRLILPAAATMLLLSQPYSRMLPGFVAQVMHGGSAQLGVLISLTGAGALVGSLVLASLPNRRRGALLLLAGLAMGLLLIAFSASSSFAAIAPIMVLLGFAQAMRQATGNVLTQTYSEDTYRGRVMSVYGLQMSLNALAAFFVGLVAAAVGIQLALAGMATLLVAGAVLLLVFAPRLRRLD